MLASTEMRAIWLVGLAACGGANISGSLATLRPACGASQYWNGSACTARGPVGELVAKAKQAIIDQDPDAAIAAFAASKTVGPMDRESYASLWEQRGIAAGFLRDKPTATTAFGMLLALDPGHVIPYGLRTDILEVFDGVRTERPRPPEVDVAWPSGLKTSDPIPLDVEVLSDPKQFLRRATIFVRARGDAEWRASDLALAAKPQRVVLPALHTAKSTALELYLRAYDDHGNEVLAWSDPARPREIPLRYDPPPRWYRNWKTYAIGGTAAVLLTGLIVYAVTLAPPDDATGSGVVK